MARSCPTSKATDGRLTNGERLEALSLVDYVGPIMAGVDGASPTEVCQGCVGNHNS